jgi:hypothetical protein
MGNDISTDVKQHSETNITAKVNAPTTYNGKKVDVVIGDNNNIYNGAKTDIQQTSSTKMTTETISKNEGGSPSLSINPWTES